MSDESLYNEGSLLQNTRISRKGYFKSQFANTFGAFSVPYFLLSNFLSTLFFHDLSPGQILICFEIKMNYKLCVIHPSSLILHPSLRDFRVFRVPFL